VEGLQFFRYAQDATQFAPGDETCLRVQISRAYYGAFLEARDRAGSHIPTGQAHESTAQHYITSGRSGIGNRLKQLRLARNVADYELRTPITPHKVTQAMKLARLILEELGALTAH
jgi:hypothetical protein